MPFLHGAKGRPVDIERESVQNREIRKTGWTRQGEQGEASDIVMSHADPVRESDPPEANIPGRSGSPKPGERNMPKYLLKDAIERRFMRKFKVSGEPRESPRDG
ncbi:MAG: hypothetical protein WBX49_02635 [Candidatus Deferrimicrobiaceae bacterium]